MWYIIDVQLYAHIIDIHLYTKGGDSIYIQTYTQAYPHIITCGYHVLCVY